MDGVNWFRCECAPGFAGPDCRISECPRIGGGAGVLRGRGGREGSGVKGHARILFLGGGLGSLSGRRCRPFGLLASSGLPAGQGALPRPSGKTDLLRVLEDEEKRFLPCFCPRYRRVSVVSVCRRLHLPGPDQRLPLRLPAGPRRPALPGL